MPYGAGCVVFLDILLQLAIIRVGKGHRCRRLAPLVYKSESVNRSVAAGRLTRFWGYVSHDPKDHEKTNQKTKDLRPSFVSQLHHPLSQGSGQPPFLQQRRIYFTKFCIFCQETCFVVQECLARYDQKRESRFDPCRDPRTEKPGRKVPDRARQDFSCLALFFYRICWLMTPPMVSAASCFIWAVAWV